MRDVACIGSYCMHQMTWLILLHAGDGPEGFHQLYATEASFVHWRKKLKLKTCMGCLSWEENKEKEKNKEKHWYSGSDL